MHRLRHGWLILVVGTLCACGAPAPARDVEARRAAQAGLAQLLREWSTPCPLPEPTPTPRSRDQVFVEALLFELPTALASATTLHNLPDLAGASSVTLLGSPHVVARFDERIRIDPSERGDFTQPPRLVASSLLPRSADPHTIVLSWELGLETAQHALQQLPLDVTARGTELGLARVAWGDAGQRSVLLLFKAHPVGGETDLRRIFECKMWLRRAALRAR